MSKVYANPVATHYSPVPSASCSVTNKPVNQAKNVYWLSPQAKSGYSGLCWVVQIDEESGEQKTKLAMRRDEKIYAMLNPDVECRNIVVWLPQLIPTYEPMES